MFKNYFELFGLEQKFDIDQDTLYKNYIKLQQAFHPDKQINKSKSEIIQVAEYSAKINEAYEILKNERKCAEYLLSLEGIKIFKEDDTLIDHDPVMLNEIFELTENANKDEINALKQLCIENFKSNYSSKNLQQAAKNIMKLRYIEKLL